MEVDSLTLGRLISELLIMMFALLSNKKGKLVVGLEFVLFVSTSIANDCGIYNIAELRENYSEIIFMISFLTVGFFSFSSLSEIVGSRSMS